MKFYYEKCKSPHDTEWMCMHEIEKQWGMAMELSFRWGITFWCHVSVAGLEDQKGGSLVGEESLINCGVQFSAYIHFPISYLKEYLLLLNPV